MTMSPAIRKAVSHAFRRWPQQPDYLAEKARLKAHIEACTEDGKIAVVRSGMDCDCTEYLDQHHIAAPSLMAWQKMEEEHEQWLDGPCSTWIGKPSDYPEGHASCDLVAEAHENGHPHSVQRRHLEIDPDEAGLAKANRQMGSQS